MSILERLQLTPADWKSAYGPQPRRPLREVASPRRAVAYLRAAGWSVGLLVAVLALRAALLLARNVGG